MKRPDIFICECGGIFDLADIRIMGYDIDPKNPYDIYRLCCDECGKLKEMPLS